MWPLYFQLLPTRFRRSIRVYRQPCCWISPVRAFGTCRHIDYVPKRINRGRNPHRRVERAPSTGSYTTASLLVLLRDYFLDAILPLCNYTMKTGCDLRPPAHMLSLRQKVRSGIDGASSVAVRVSARLATQAGSVAS